MMSAYMCARFKKHYNELENVMKPNISSLLFFYYHFNFLLPQSNFCSGGDSYVSYKMEFCMFFAQQTTTWSMQKNICTVFQFNAILAIIKLQFHSSVAIHRADIYHVFLICEHVMLHWCHQYLLGYYCYGNEWELV